MQLEGGMGSGANWHKLAMGQNAVDVHLPLKQYVTAVREGAEWVPFEPPSEDGPGGG